MRRAFALALIALAFGAPAQAASWEEVHDRAIVNHDLEHNWGKEFGALSAGSFFYQEYRAEVVDEVRADWVETLPVFSGSSSYAAPVGSVQSIICSVFGPYCSQALSVAGCESGFSTSAVNGQYLGIFQMGSSERATYGHGPDARSQALAAYAYFVAAGSDWSPWACKP